MVKKQENSEGFYLDETKPEVDQLAQLDNYLTQEFSEMKKKTDLLGMSLNEGEEYLEDRFAYEESSKVYPAPGV